MDKPAVCDHDNCDLQPGGQRSNIGIVLIEHWSNRLLYDHGYSETN